MKLGGMILISLEDMKESCAVIRGFSFFFPFAYEREGKRDRGERKQKKMRGGWRETDNRTYCGRNMETASRVRLGAGSLGVR